MHMIIVEGMPGDTPRVGHTNTLARSLHTTHARTRAHVHTCTRAHSTRARTHSGHMHMHTAIEEAHVGAQTG